VPGTLGRPPPPVVVVVGIVVGRWVRGQKPKKDRGQIFFITFLNRVFELPSPPPRNAQKCDKPKCKNKNVLDFFVDFLVKTFRHDFFCKTFFAVLLNSHR
jgi:hypothetical protein